ncbi:hypothetical protein AMEX_G26342 [Astyanax mexicanus]|uniref:Uncharacterized protein n=1 Tax=Astyanax mexicanus TaxID=7994 RepID=A0A8T2KUF7_ASTMX|nr:hypothetical protein AMEX_G26342 [Astyanax mexicanus]
MDYGSSSSPATCFRLVAHLSGLTLKDYMLQTGCPPVWSATDDHQRLLLVKGHQSGLTPMDFWTAWRLLPHASGCLATSQLQMKIRTVGVCF